MTGARRSNWEVIEHSFNGGQGVSGDPQFPGAPTATSIHDFPDDTSCGETRQPVGGGAGANEFRSDCEVAGFSAQGAGGGDKCFASLPSGAGGGGGGKKSFFDKDDVESVLIEHSRKSWWNIFVVCKRIFRYVIACIQAFFGHFSVTQFMKRIKMSTHTHAILYRVHQNPLYKLIDFKSLTNGRDFEAVSTVWQVGTHFDPLDELV